MLKHLAQVLPKRLALLRSGANGSGNDFNSYMVTAPHRRRLQEELAEIAFAFCAKNLAAGHAMDVQQVRAIVGEFFEIYPHKPVAHNSGGSGFHNCFWLFVTAKILNPAVLVESGVWKGQGSWILRQACPQAAMHCFDLSFRRLVYRDAQIHYHEMDWENFSFAEINPAQSLCFFDDHVNQARRVREAYGKGFRTMLFDDNAPAHKLYGFGLPGVPTIDMLCDERCTPGDRIEWVWKGKKRSYLYQREDEYSAKDLLQHYAVFPDVASVARYGSHSFLSLVRLVD